jgi:hypothetical protein
MDFLDCFACCVDNAVPYMFGLGVGAGGCAIPGYPLKKGKGTTKPTAIATRIGVQTGLWTYKSAQTIYAITNKLSIALLFLDFYTVEGCASWCATPAVDT